MSSLNTVTLVGHLGRKPELRYTAMQAAYALLSLATNETSLAKGPKQERTEWHRIVTWGRTAAACAQHLNVGRQVLVRGRLCTRSWTDRQGVQRWSTEVLAEARPSVRANPPSRSSLRRRTTLPPAPKTTSRSRSSPPAGARRGRSVSVGWTPGARSVPACAFPGRSAPRPLRLARVAFPWCGTP